MDSRTTEDARSAFPRIIAELSAFDAFLLYDLAHLERGSIDGQISNRYRHPAMIAVRDMLAPKHEDTPEDQILSSLDHLKSLGLIDVRSDKIVEFHPSKGDWTVHIGINHFGQQFVKTCLPDKDRLETIRKATSPAIVEKNPR
jgi:hypothetical protein